MKWLIRLLGGYLKQDLTEVYRVGKVQGANTENGDAVDLPSWHYNKFGKRFYAGNQMQKQHCEAEVGDECLW